MILGNRGIKEAYRTGRGKVRVRGISEIEAMPNGKSRIVISELPYLVNKARLIEKIAELVKDKKMQRFRPHGVWFVARTRPPGTFLWFGRRQSDADREAAPLV